MISDGQPISGQATHSIPQNALQPKPLARGFLFLKKNALLCLTVF